MPARSLHSSRWNRPVTMSIIEFLVVKSQRGNQGGDEGPVGKESHLKPLEVGLHQDF